MKIILSPSKTLEFETAAQLPAHTQPKFLAESVQLNAQMRKFSPEQLAKLMSISEKLANLNHERFQNWQTPFTPANAKQCIFAFKGDVYEGLDAESLTAKDIDFAQEHLRILSGLYGLLRPLDLIQAYRLEMGTKLKPSLYAFWGDKLTNEIGDELVINLASVEYFSAIKPQNLLNVEFKESKGNQLKIVGIFAKKARGLMARYMIKNRITAPEKIKKFNVAGYEFREDLSNDKNFIFAR